MGQPSIYHATVSSLSDWNGTVWTGQNLVISYEVGYNKSPLHQTLRYKVLLVPSDFILGLTFYIKPWLNMLKPDMKQGNLHIWSQGPRYRCRYWLGGIAEVGLYNLDLCKGHDTLCNNVLNKMMDCYTIWSDDHHDSGDYTLCDAPMIHAHVHSLLIVQKSMEKKRSHRFGKCNITHNGLLSEDGSSSILGIWATTKPMILCLMTIGLDRNGDIHIVCPDFQSYAPLMPLSHIEVMASRKTHLRRFLHNGVGRGYLGAVTGSTWQLRGLHGAYWKLMHTFQKRFAT